MLDERSFLSVSTNVRILDVFFPKRCVGCGRIGTYFCFSCVRSIRHRASSNPKFISFFRYEGVVRKAIKALKYRYVSDLADEFVSLVPDMSFPGAVLIPIPLHQSRLRFRGFNQTEVLGGLFAKKFHISMRADILRRVRPTAAQAEIKNRSDRIKNVQNVFSVNSGALKHCHADAFILFDDVVTSGATLANARYALMKAGVKDVRMMTLAR